MKLEPKEVQSFASRHRASECGAGSRKERPVSSGTLGFLEAVILSCLLTDEEMVFLRPGSADCKEQDTLSHLKGERGNNEVPLESMGRKESNPSPYRDWREEPEKAPGARAAF